ncbi:MAG: DUF488 domain-containing protein [Alphaproteobacteria bacterium]
MTDIEIKRIYEDYAASDGYRVLIDKLWPRGISKEEAHIDYWAKELTPTTEIRKEFNHEDDHWLKFKHDYLQELKANTTVDEFVEQIQNKKKVTLLYGAKNPVHNHAVILRDFLKTKGKKK